MSKTAILVDGGFYRKRASHLWGKHSPEETADGLVHYCYRHLKERHATHDLYRIFYYDCPPISKKMYHPLLGKTIDLGQHEQFKWMNDFLSELKQRRKVALRLGVLDDSNSVYTLKYDAIKKLCSGSLSRDDLKESDFVPTITQKGVDMKIGIDIASLAYKKQVEQIVLIAGDSDFVPAAKLARREGVDIVLDSLDQPVKENLFEHIDGKRSCGNPYTIKSRKDMNAYKL
ncbi:NYN domain-containing protein [uncultured Intestinimonas sp.]|uniref:NYN domain-containing protein n=1 Tax=uncultured Intestinimonas sp. TaxID=1689265 RepID=UPI002941FB1B|nr:NYN domain-containing protein [uncultured Intestinimonas sp.]